MNNKRPLVPPFLNRLDKRLLLNKPDVWSTRTHLVVYYGILFVALLTTVSFIIPDDPRSNSPVFYWVGFAIILSILALTVWLLYLLRFNVFKRYGNISPLSRLSVFLLCFVSVGIIALFPLVMPAVESIRANKAYADTEIGNDINAMNIKICQLEYDSLSHDLKVDTLLVVDTLPRYHSMPEEAETMANDSAVVTHPAYRPHVKTADTLSLQNELFNADSSRQLNDSMFLLYNAADYTFVRRYYMDSNKTLTDFDMYKSIIRNFKPVDRKQTRSELYVLLNKYKLDDDRTINGYEYYNNESIYERIAKRYELFPVNHSIDNISERKYRWENENKQYIIRSWFYATLIITLLIFIFRHTTKQAFFLSWLTGVVLTIATSLAVAYFATNKSSFLIWIIAYLILFFFVSLLAFRNKIRRTATGIGINFFVLMIAFLPTLMVGYYYDWLIRKNTDKAIPDFIDYEAMYNHQLYAEIAGVVLLLILLATYIQKVYRHWYALPEE